MEDESIPLKDRLVIRAARPEDRGPVLAFCADTFSWGDYIGDVWDRWLADVKGRLLVAELEGLPIGIQHVSFPSAREAYLQGMRVDPAVRRQGVATALLRAGLALARRQGARVARLLTRSDNEVVHRMVEAAGFRRATTFVDWRGTACAGAGRYPEAAVLGDVEDLWRLIEGSEHFHCSDRAYLADWQALELTNARLAAHVAAGEVYVARRTGQPVAMAHVQWNPEGDSLWAGALFGETSQLAELARQLRAHASHVGALEVVSFVPKVEVVTDALGMAGYDAASPHRVDDMDLFVTDLASP